MNDRPAATLPQGYENALSLLALGTILLRSRWRIARWMLAGAVLAAIPAAMRPVLYRGSASFIPQGSEGGGSSGLASIAGQFGVAIPSANAAQSPEFYQRVLSSRVVLEPIVRDTFVVPELGGRRVPFLDLFEVEGDSPAERTEIGVSLLRRMAATSVTKSTGAVDVGVATKWPTVSAGLVTRMVAGINEFNQRQRQGQAAAERKFIESRLQVATADLRRAEDELQRYLTSNRQFEGSPQLRFAHDRMQRDVTLKQGVFTSLTQAYEDARIREVRDTPVITVIEPAAVPTLPEPRGRVRSVILGALAGGFLGTLVAFATAMFARRRREGDPDAAELERAIASLRPAGLRRSRAHTPA